MSAPSRTLRKGHSLVSLHDSDSGSDGLADYLARAARYPRLSREREQHLGERVRKYGDAEAARELVEHNLLLVVAVAKAFQGRGLPLADLISEGNLGLIKAAERYDERRAAFSTCAVWWIRQAISRGAMDRGRAIRLPVHTHAQRNRYQRALTGYVGEYHRLPASHDELLAYAREASLTLTRRAIEVAEALPDEPVSLTTPTYVPGHHEGAAGQIADTIEDDEAAERLDRLERETDSSDAVEGALDDLTERERLILTLRLDLEGTGETKTLVEVGRELGVTRERVRQIEEKALGKLRAHYTYEGGHLVRRTPAAEAAERAVSRQAS